MVHSGLCLDYDPSGLQAADISYADGLRIITIVTTELLQLAVYGEQQDVICA